MKSIGKAGPQLRTGFKGVEIDAFIFERAPQALDEDIVHPAAAPVHADAHLPRSTLVKAKLVN
jgi:hypothetical protein